MNEIQQVVFVCTGNICRSPLAEAILAKLAYDQPHIFSQSAGVAANDGQRASENSIAVARENNLDLSNFRSRYLTRDIVNSASHIFALANHHIHSILDNYPEAEKKTYLLNQFSADDTLRNTDVPDPIGYGINSYREIYQIINSAMPPIVEFLKQSKKS